MELSCCVGGEQCTPRVSSPQVHRNMRPCTPPCADSEAPNVDFEYRFGLAELTLNSTPRSDCWEQTI
jgi:hypothetical protein